MEHARTLKRLTTMNIFLPDALKSFVEEQIAQRGYGSASDYVRELICKDQDRLRLRDLLLQGAESSLGNVADATYFDGLRDRVRQRCGG
jgi:antitoxin ParD1/3/4